MKLVHLMLITLIIPILIAAGCANAVPDQDRSGKVQKIDPGIEVPEGFKLDVYAKVPNARSLCLASDGTLFVGSRQEGNVYAVRDTDGDHKGDKVSVVADNLNAPNGVAFKDGDLYVAEISRILRFSDILSTDMDSEDYEVVYDEYPTEGHHGWKYIAFGPDGLLYVPVGAPCNICHSEDSIFASITTLDVSTKEMNILHRGIRNTVGFNWHPVTGDLWFTDNGRDWMGDDMPADELNHAKGENLHFGYPFCHQGDAEDPEFGHQFSCEKFTPPVQKLGAHVAALGLEFYKPGNFPKNLENSIFIAEHGSWNRSAPIGYRISRVVLEGDKAVRYEPFVSGFRAKEEEVLGRPVDLEWLTDGSLVFSDDHHGVVYRLYYDGS